MAEFDKGSADSGSLPPSKDESTKQVLTKTSKSKVEEEEFVTQQPKGFREGWSTWAKQLPKLNFNEQDKNFQLIDREEMRNYLIEKGADAESIQKLEADMDHLDRELLGLFRDRDYTASLQQNRYRTYQIGFSMLAALATIIGAFQALAINDNPNLLPYLAFGETLVALFTTYLATISGSVSPLPAWLSNRRHAEYLRREYFRYLMDLEPYDQLTGTDRKLQLSIRAANINRGIYPDKSASG
ncbi:MAG: hypothetical protein Phog2KO_45830 [Phototrophicaceae bacterium]